MIDTKHKTAADRKADAREQQKEPLKTAIAKAATTKQALAVIAQEAQDLSADLAPIAPSHSKRLQELSDLAVTALGVDPRKPTEEKKRPHAQVRKFQPVSDGGRPPTPAQRVTTMTPVQDPKHPLEG